jgi:hypothetical protein
MRNAVLSLPIVVVFAAHAAPAQTTHLVGPGGLPQIRDALAVAMPGDVIHVLPGTYAQFDANVGVTIRALVPGTVTIAYDPAFTPANCVAFPLACWSTEGPTYFRPPVGQHVHVVGLLFAPTWNASFFWHSVQVTSGRVTFDECVIQIANRTALTVSQAAVHLQDSLVHCTSGFSGVPYPSFVASNAEITAIGCQIYGAQAAPVGTGQFPQPGLRLLGSRFQGSRLTVTGGNQSMGTAGATALHADSTSSAWITDSTLVAGPGHCAIEGLVSAVHVDRCTITHDAPNCAAGTSWPFLLGVERTAPLQPGAVFELRYRTEPNGVVGIFASHLPGTVDFMPLLAQPSWLGENQWFTAGVVAADATGLAVATWAIPNGPYSDLTLWFHGVSGFTFPLQGSALAGGVVR